MGLHHGQSDGCEPMVRRLHDAGAVVGAGPAEHDEEVLEEVQKAWQQEEREEVQEEVPEGISMSCRGNLLVLVPECKRFKCGVPREARPPLAQAGVVWLL